ncbi:hypothetical protein GF366_03475 [Candidatus Peregrinibacteria bacterium]|nr:hypothetical protein [Candidatus Peregrinibacteria bacterium]
MKISKITKKSLLCLLFSVMVFSLCAPPVFAQESTKSGLQVASADFTDVPLDYKYYSAITFLRQNGIINGYPDGTFKPENTINRAEVLKVVLEGSSIESPEDFGLSTFPDVPSNAWFARFVMKGKDLGIVSGNAEDNTFAPTRNVNKAEFIKMLLEANKIKQEALEATSKMAPDVPDDAWFAPYVNYAAMVGVISPDENGNLNPGKILTRAEVANMIYLLTLIKGKYNTQLLLDIAEQEMIQIDQFIAANKISEAKTASDLAVDLTWQAYQNNPDDKVVVGAAKLAKAYNWLVESFIFAVQGDNAQAEEWANKAIDKAGEAWEVNNDTQIIARHIKDIARDILAQVGGTEY